MTGLPDARALKGQEPLEDVSQFLSVSVGLSQCQNAKCQNFTFGRICCPFSLHSMERARLKAGSSKGSRPFWGNSMGSIPSLLHSSFALTHLAIPAIASERKIFALLSFFCKNLVMLQYCAEKIQCPPTAPENCCWVLEILAPNPQNFSFPLMQSISSLYLRQGL